MNKRTDGAEREGQCLQVVIVELHMRNLLQVANFSGQLIDSIISNINLAQASVLRRREVGAV